MKKIFFLTVLLFASILCAFAAKVDKKQDNKAAKAKTELSTEDRRKFDYYFYEAIRQRQLRNFDASVDLLTECYYINPRSSAVAYEFAMVYTAIQDVPKALSFMTMASRLDQSNSWYKMGLAELFIKNNDYQSAILVYENIAKNHPEKDDVDYMLASLYKQTGEIQKSIKSLNAVEKKFGINEAISFEKFRLYKVRGENKKANAEIDRLIAKYPMEYKYQILRGEIYVDEGQPKKALECFEQVRSADPNNVALLMAMYNFYITTGDSIAADNVFGSVFQNPQTDIDDKLSALTQYLSIRDLSVTRAEGHFNDLLNQYPDNEILHTYYVSFLLMQRRFDDAVPELEFLIANNPTNKEAWEELIKLYAAQENVEKLLETTNRAIAQLPREPTFYLLKSIALVQQEKFDEALQNYKTGLDTLENNRDTLALENLEMVAEFNMQIADIYAMQNNLKEAFFYYEKAYQLNPNHAGLLNNYAYYLSIADRDLDKAELMSAKAVQAYPENVSFLDTYAWIFFKQGNMTLARMYIMQAIDKGGDKNPVVAEHYGDILYQNGQPEEALRWWQNSKELGNTSSVLEQKIETRKYIPEHEPFSE
ncbi:MAG: tetratricopeptide repeat protein [Prevotellaceae bacterium]|jgi:tetratricopeptide (TPR) repeat protein|nr:tetratricopeptide repeat protein [Prevotellaceae bacterium]